MEKKPMKKAFIDQILLGFVLFAALITFGATVADEYQARNKYYKLDKLAHIATRAMAKHYMYNEDMTDAQNVADAILNETSLGSEVITNNNRSYVWRDLDSDGSPDTVTTYIQKYVHSNFWYRLFEQATFNIPDTDASAYVTKDMSEVISMVIRFGGSNAGYHNMIGIYEIDGQGCVQNPRLLLVNKEDHNIGDELGSFNDVQNTRFFLIPDGYDAYGNRSATLNSTISMSGCEPNIPTTTIDGMTDNTVTYFQQTQFNTDNGYDHMHEIAKSVHDEYLTFINTPISYCTRYRRGNCVRWGQREATWEDWETHATANSIDYNNDPNDEYIIAMEDLPNGGDKDFNDILLDTTKVRKPGDITTEDAEDGTDVSP